MKKKKSLVGWTWNDWQLWVDSLPGISDERNKKICISNEIYQRKTGLGNILEDGSKLVKVRITIEEL